MNAGRYDPISSSNPELAENTENTRYLIKEFPIEQFPYSGEERRRLSQTTHELHENTCKITQ